MKFIIAIAIAVIPCAANAAPVYLQCQLTQDVGQKAPWDVTLNEEAGTVTYTFPELGRAYTVPGVFTAGKVTFRSFTINRTNFAFLRDLSSLQAPDRAALIDHGRCALAEVKRAF